MTTAIERRRASAQERAWLHNTEEAENRREELLTIIHDQYRVAVTGAPPPCACCGVELEWRQLYRCHRCDLWLCPMCSRPHFDRRDTGALSAELESRRAGDAAIEAEVGRLHTEAVRLRSELASLTIQTWAMVQSQGGEVVAQREILEDWSEQDAMQRTTSLAGDVVWRTSRFLEADDGA